MKPFSLLAVLVALALLASLASCKRRPQPATPPATQPAAQNLGAPLPPATRITLNLKEANLEQAVTALAQQAGIAVRVGSPRAVPPEAWNRSISYQCDGKPFWEAVTEIGRMFEAYPAQEGTDARKCVTLAPAPGGWSCPAQAAGPFLITVASSSRSRSADLSPGGMPGKNQILLSLEVRREPGIPVITLGSPVIEQALDERGNELVAAQQSIPYRPAIDQWMTHLSCSLTGGPGMGDRIASIKGHFLVGFCERMERFEFTGLKDSIDRTMTSGSVRATIREFKDIPGTPTITLELEGLDERVRGWVVSNPPILLDDKGVAYQPSSRRPVKGEESRFQLQYSRMPQPGMPTAIPTALIVEVPAGLAESYLRFEFQDIALP